MKYYEKPTVEMYSLNGNETICGGCQVKLKLEENASIAETLDFLGGNADDVLTKAEVSMIFGSNEDCQNPVETYCKFNGTVSGLSWS